MGKNNIPSSYYKSRKSVCNSHFNFIADSLYIIFSAVVLKRETIFFNLKQIEIKG